MRRLSISEVCDLLAVKPHVLRYWERQVSLLQPAKGASGRREYSMRDVELLFRLKYLLTERKFTLEGAVQKLIEESAGAQANAKGSLQAVRTTLLDTARRVKGVAERIAELNPGASADLEATAWLKRRPVSTFDPEVPWPYTRAPRAGAARPTGAPYATGGPYAAVVSLAPNWNLSPGESPVMEPVISGGGATPLELTAAKVRRLAGLRDGADQAATPPPWLILVPSRIVPLVESYLSERNYFGLYSAGVTVIALPDLAADSATTPGTHDEVATPTEMYSSPMAVAWAMIATGRLAVPGDDGTVLWLPLSAPFEELPDQEVYRRHRESGASITALAWEYRRGGDKERPRRDGSGARDGSENRDGRENRGGSENRGAARLLPTGVMLCDRGAVEDIAESLTVRPSSLRRDLIPPRDSADLDARRGGYARRGDYAYVGIPELVAADGRGLRGPRGRIMARGGRPPMFVRTRGEARQALLHREAPAK